MSPISNEFGVEILTVLLKNSDNAVADDPIIWFMTSQIALMFSSFNSNSSSGVSIPISISTITFTSCFFNSMILLPLSPAIYVISTPTAGSRFAMSNSSFVKTLTTGVVMSTLALSMVDTAVAEAPRLIFSISPMASISNALKFFESIHIFSLYTHLALYAILPLISRFPMPFLPSFLSH